MGDLYEAMWLPTQERPDRKEGDATWQKLVEAAQHRRKMREAMKRNRETGDDAACEEARQESREMWRLVNEAKGKTK